MAVELQIELCVRVTVAAALSSLIGLEREMQGHAAGLRTHMLVGLGAALFTTLSLFAFEDGDPARVAAQIVTGVGFLGAGTIIQRRDRHVPHGLTTAAGIWAVSAIGMACGAGAYVLGVFSTLLILFVLIMLARISERIHAAQKRRGIGSDLEQIGERGV
ncbi:MAG: MgtC/SapB family protein [Thermoflexales bacterium]|nr:MgtC/SapB family protein [Thermoflexales bacterium]MDW8351543.1 MgtC/SapB family protein [Anaerolineae bacterium]